MIVLGLDTSSSLGAAVWADGRVLAARSSEAPRGRASDRLLPMIDEVLVEGGRIVRDGGDEALDQGVEALDRIALAVGPGSFTGLRVGIATALGLVAPLAAPPALVPISTLTALRHAALRKGAETADASVVLRLRRGEWALQTPDGEERILRSGETQPLARAVVREAEVEAAYAEGLFASNTEVLRVDAGETAPAVAALGAFLPPVSPEHLTPRYLKAPYA